MNFVFNCGQHPQEGTLNRIGPDITNTDLKLFYFVRNVLVPTETKTFLVEEAEEFCHLVTFQLRYRSTRNLLYRPPPLKFGTQILFLLSLLFAIHIYIFELQLVVLDF